MAIVPDISKDLPSVAKQKIFDYIFERWFIDPLGRWKILTSNMTEQQALSIDPGDVIYSADFMISYKNLYDYVELNPNELMFVLNKQIVEDYIVLSVFASRLGIITLRFLKDSLTARDMEFLKWISFHFIQF